MSDSLLLARTRLAGTCPEPIEAALIVHRPEGVRRRWFGGGDLASRLGTNGWLVLTTSHLRLYALGGRDGITPKAELGAWPRHAVAVDVEGADRSAFFASTGSSLEYRVHRLHLTGPDLDLTVDVKAVPYLFGDDQDLVTDEAIAAEPDPEVREGLLGLRAEVDDVLAMLRAVVTGTADPSASP